jgi:hypothetical protein
VLSPQSNVSLLLSVPCTGRRLLSSARGFDTWMVSGPTRALLLYNYRCLTAVMISFEATGGFYSGWKSLGQSTVGKLEPTFLRSSSYRALVLLSSCHSRTELERVVSVNIESSTSSLLVLTAQLDTMKSVHEALMLGSGRCSPLCQG